MKTMAKYNVLYGSRASTCDVGSAVHLCMGALTACLLHLGNCSSERIHALYQTFFLQHAQITLRPPSLTSCSSVNRRVRLVGVEFVAPLG